jgi:uncharacterized membrane protein
VFYLAYLGGIVWFAVRPALVQGIGAGALGGALLGAMCYMTYDLTNQATLARWPLHVTLIDVCWGSFATATAAAAGVWAARTFGG